MSNIDALTNNLGNVQISHQQQVGSNIVPEKDIRDKKVLIQNLPAGTIISVGANRDAVAYKYELQNTEEATERARKEQFLLASNQRIEKRKDDLMKQNSVYVQQRKVSQKSIEIGSVVKGKIDEFQALHAEKEIFNRYKNEIAGMDKLISLGYELEIETQEIIKNSTLLSHCYAPAKELQTYHNGIKKEKSKEIAKEKAKLRYKAKREVRDKETRHLGQIPKRTDQSDTVRTV